MSRTLEKKAITWRHTNLQKKHWPWPNYGSFLKFRLYALCNKYCNLDLVRPLLIEPTGSFYVYDAGGKNLCVGECHLDWDVTTLKKHSVSLLLTINGDLPWGINWQTTIALRCQGTTHLKQNILGEDKIFPPA